jgi:hypothetical protein
VTAVDVRRVRAAPSAPLRDARLATVVRRERFIG